MACEGSPLSVHLSSAGVLCVCIFTAPSLFLCQFFSCSGEEGSFAEPACPLSTILIVVNMCQKYLNHSLSSLRKLTCLSPPIRPISSNLNKMATGRIDHLLATPSPTKVLTQPTCCICWTPYTEKTETPVKLPCNHIIGKDCITQWAGGLASTGRYNGCPVCRAVLLSPRSPPTHIHWWGSCIEIHHLREWNDIRWCQVAICFLILTRLIPSFFTRWWVIRIALFLPSLISWVYLSYYIAEGMGLAGIVSSLAENGAVEVCCHFAEPILFNREPWFLRILLHSIIELVIIGRSR